MKNFELFGRKVDFLIVPVLTAAAIYLFYGGLAAVLTLAWIAVVGHLKPLHRLGYTREQLVIVGSALALTFSVFLRSIFFEAYCATAPWAVNSELHTFMGLDGPCFIRGGYLQYIAEDSWRSLVRDALMPLSGLALLFYVLSRPATRRNVTLGACLLLAFGLWVNAPLFNHQTEVAEEDETQGTVVITAVQPTWIQVYERGGGTLSQMVLSVGESFRVPAAATAPLLRTAKPEALRITVAGKQVGPIGTPATAVSNVSLLPSDLLNSPHEN